MKFITEIAFLAVLSVLFIVLAVVFLILGTFEDAIVAAILAISPAILSLKE